MNKTLSEREYEVGRYSDLDGKLRARLWQFLNEHDNLIRLEAACDMHRPAVEGIIRPLVLTFNESVDSKRVRRFIGFLIKQILLGRGFELDTVNVKVGVGDLFMKAARYKRKF